MRKERTKELLNRLSDIKVLVVGDIILDRYVHGRVERISPEAPVPVLEVEEEEFRLGGAANVAKNLTSLKVKAYLSGVVGEDEAGERVRELLRENGIESFLASDKRPTTEKTRVVSRSQQLLRIDREDRSKVSGEALRKIREALHELDYDGVIVSDYAKGTITYKITDFLRERECFWAVDPRPINRSLYRGASLITPNERELRDMTEPLSTDSVEDLGIKLKRELEIDTLVVTRGSEGMVLFGDRIQSFPAKAREVYDVTGAGDTVVATLVAFYLAGATWEEACEIANVCAGIVVGELGTASVSPEELLREMDEEGQGVRGYSG
ncbi:MAG TPA: D-glycero-beta-D-manno-heptose-7-phosphate kinase [Aquificaceae bacterium]|nr:D-glycero-beta-D-manno-heptose-7-phosphate kinase [Aquificaceae bacterium]HIQ30605.1 D-glycero-beta-D-manno-heptose-7-phosphate kinase [Aquifex aeolicus]